MRVKSVEIWRLAFAISIVLCHAMYLPWDTDTAGNMKFHVNSLGVEFFFILSGFLMAKSACGGGASLSLGSETTAFLLKKLKPIYPAFLFAACFELVIRFTLRMVDISDWKNIVYNVWDLLFLRVFGLGGTTDLLVGASWYLFALFPAMWLLFPLLRKYTNVFLHIIAPLLALCLFGWFERRYGNINYALHLNEWNVCLGLLRAIAEVSIGCVAYVLCETMKAKYKNNRPSVLLTILEVACLAAIFPFAIFGTRSRTDFLCILLICVGIIAAFSEKSYTNILLAKIPDRWIANLSSYSVALYLNHYVWLRTFQSWKWAVPYNTELLIYFTLSLLTAFVCLTTTRIVEVLFRRAAEQGKARRIEL